MKIYFATSSYSLFKLFIILSMEKDTMHFLTEVANLESNIQNYS